MKAYIVSCEFCEQESLIELISPEDIERAACPICQEEGALLLLNSAEEYMPDLEDIASLLDIGL